MWHNGAWPRAKPIDWNRINPLAKDYDLFLMHYLEVRHIRTLIGLSAGDYFFSASFLSHTGFMLFPLTQGRPQLGPGVFLYFPTTRLNQMSNTCSAANIITANLLSHNSCRLLFPRRFPPLFLLFSIYTKPSVSVNILSQLCKETTYQILVFSRCGYLSIVISKLALSLFIRALFLRAQIFDVGMNFSSMLITDTVQLKPNLFFKKKQEVVRSDM